MMIKRIKKKIFEKFFNEFKQKPILNTKHADYTSDEIKIIDEVSELTMTNSERIVSLIRAVKYIEKHKIPGDIVECGVWRGGSIMAILKTLISLKSFDRNIYLYDTFEGMSEPSLNDLSFKGESALKFYSENEEYCFSSLDEVKRNVQSLGYPVDKIHYIKGKVENTIPGIVIAKEIALLRLDTDWYESTLHELNHLFPRLSLGGAIIIDDYGHWQGCKKAVDEYLSANKVQLFLSRIDYTCRIGIKN